MKKIKHILRNERGLTLVEALAVFVILAIIAVIAIPSIGGLIDNSKKDAHIANAQQLISSAKMYVTADKKYSTGPHTITLQDLIDKKYLEEVEDPDGEGKPYVSGEVDIKDGIVETVTLVGKERSISKAKPSDLKRSIFDKDKKNN